MFVRFFIDILDVFFSFLGLLLLYLMFFITVSLCDVRLSHLNKDYLLTYLLSSLHTVIIPRYFYFVILRITTTIVVVVAAAAMAAGRWALTI